MFLRNASHLTQSLEKNKKSWGNTKTETRIQNRIRTETTKTETDMGIETQLNWVWVSEPKSKPK